jgi:NADH dehydrogenase
VVNLAGIKREAGAQTFEAVHVGATHRLLAACREAGIRRFVHVSVVCSRPDARSPYHDTKWRAEEAVRASGLEVTIIKPGVIYGRGDDMITHLVRMIRFAPVFPVVGRGTSILQPVDVRDVAESIAAALERDISVGATYDLVGPERLTLRDVVRTAAEGAGLDLVTLPTPILLHRIAVRVMALTPAPLSTPAQLQMLVDGLYGDPAPAQRDLGIVPRPFTADSVRAVEAAIGPLLGVSLRLVDNRTRAEWLARRRGAFTRALQLAAGALALQLLLASVVANVWYRMAAAAILLSAVALARIDVGWREIYRPSVRHIVAGAAAAAVLYFLGAGVARLLALHPLLASQMDVLYGWRDAVPEGLAVPLVLLIVAGEEIAWRSAVTLPLAARLGPWTGTIAAAALFGLAHLPMGVPLLLLAALGAGAFWGALVVKTRSAVPALVSHALWDLAVLFWFPYVRS